eukprot:6203427-Pleurochrysis_carterae.AAC.2
MTAYTATRYRAVRSGFLEIPIWSTPHEMELQAILNLYRDVPRVSTIRAGLRGIFSTDTESHWQESWRRRGGWTPTGRLKEK